MFATSEDRSIDVTDVDVIEVVGDVVEMTLGQGGNGSDGKRFIYN